MEPVGSRRIFNRTKRLIAAVFALLLFAGCEEKAAIYSQAMVPEAVTLPSCLAVESEEIGTEAVVAALLDAGIAVSSGCGVRVRVTKSYALCSVQEKNSEASGGVVRMELFKNETLFYRIQREFWDEGDRELVALLISRMKAELPVKRP
jgi:hypothetical protein